MADPYGPNKPPQFGEVGIEEALANADKYGKEFGGVPSVSRTLAAEVRRLREERDAAKRDARRFDWWFSFEPSKSAGVIEDYLIGMSEAWDLDKWRACIDKHMVPKTPEEILAGNDRAWKELVCNPNAPVDVNDLERTANRVYDFVLAHDPEAIDLAALKAESVSPEHLCMALRAMYHLRTRIKGWEQAVEVAEAACVSRGLDLNDVMYGLKQPVVDPTSQGSDHE